VNDRDRLALTAMGAQDSLATQPEERDLAAGFAERPVW
jgi:hypothetical protein